MEFRVLGPLEVLDDGRVLGLGGPKQRSLLALLLLNANRVVSTDRLTDEVWGEAADGAARTLQVYVSNLRKLLEPRRGPGAEPSVLVTRKPGYVLCLESVQLDVLHFETLLAEGRARLAVGDAKEAVSRLRAALDLWRGPLLADLAGEPFVVAETARLEHLRLDALETCFDAELAAGRHAEVAGELETAVDEHPLRERLWAQLMLALYRAGRQSEALRACGRVRRILGEELGIEPGAELVRLEDAILVHKPELDWVPDEAETHLASPSPAAAVRLPLPPQLALPSAGFFGRSRERAAIDAALDAALEGRRQLVFVAGEAGIGKTRLATEVAIDARARGVNVVYGRCDEDLGVPYQPLVEALTYTVRQCPEGAIPAIIGGSPAELVRLVPDLAKCVPGITPPTAGDPETERYWLFDAVAGWLAAMSTATPLVLVLDDLHWATTPTLLMLRHLARSQETMRLLIVGLYRDSDLRRGHPLTGMLADLHRERNVSRVVLGGLDVTGVRALVEEASPRALDDAGAELAEALQTGTGGNPFYVGEILRSLVETDALGGPGGRRASALTIDKLSLPESVREVVGGRLARLSDAANRMIAAAAVAGPSFSLALLEAVPDAADGSVALIDTLDEAVEAAILVETGRQTDGYSFAHAVIRQVAYGRLNAARRARLHQQVGDALERMPANEGARLSGLAYHFAEAARTPYVDKAVDYALRAARHALNQLAFEEAITHLERGLRMFELAEHSGGTRRAELLLVLADVRFQVLDRQGVKQAAMEVADIARATGSSELLARAAIACKFIAWFGRLEHDVVAICEDALDALHPDDVGLRAQVLATLVVHRAASGEGWRTEAIALEAVDLARRADSPETLAIALWARWNALAGSERAAEELPLADELIQLASAAGSAVFEFSGHHWRGGCRLALADIAGFEEDCAALARLADRTHSADILAHCEIWQASRALLEGRFDDAERHMTDLLTHVGDDPNFLNAYGALLMWLRFEQGRLAEFKDLALGYVAQYPDVPVLRAALALLHLELAEVEEAQAAFKDVAVGELINVPRDFTWPATLALLAEFVARRGGDQAQQLYEFLYPYRGQLLALGNGGTCIGAADRYLGMLAMTAGRNGLAQQHYETALEVEQAIGAKPLSTRTRYWQGRLLMGSDDPTDHERARVVLDEVIEAATGLGMRALADQAVSAGPTATR